MESGPPQPTTAKRPRLSSWIALSVAILAAAWLVGLVSFIAADGHFELSLPRTAPDPDQTHNLASFQHGPILRASSYHADWFAHHHPIFLVDGRESPGEIEKWVSGWGDRRPWVEIRWREPHELAWIVLRHTAAVEPRDQTAASYTVRCLKPHGTGPSFVSRTSGASMVRHDLPCPGATGVRIDFHPDRNTSVRLYELEAWGT